MTQPLMIAQIHSMTDVITEESTQRVLINNGVKSLFITTNDDGMFVIRAESNNDLRDLLDFSISGNIVTVK